MTRCWKGFAGSPRAARGPMARHKQGALSRLLCAMGWHRWSKPWSLFPDWQKQPMRRACLRCGSVQRKDHSSDAWVNLGEAKR